MRNTQSLDELMANFAQPGRVRWLGVREKKWQPMRVVESIEVSPETGVSGDHYSGRSGKRQITLVQAEHLVAVAGMQGVANVSPEQVRRNVMVEGINLLALKSAQFFVGDAVLEFTGLCHPCSRMETILGEGGYNAMRGHGGITARVIQAGTITINDAVKVVD